MNPDHIQYYLSQAEPTKSCLLAAREFILAFDKRITEAWKYRMPFFLFKGKMFCYFWKDKKTAQPYLGIVEGRHIEHPALVQGNRARMKIMYLDPLEDLPLDTLSEILDVAIAVYEG